MNAQANQIEPASAHEEIKDEIRRGYERLWQMAEEDLFDELRCHDTNLVHAITKEINEYHEHLLDIARDASTNSRHIAELLTKYEAKY